MHRTMAVVACAAILLAGCGAPGHAGHGEPTAVHTWVPVARVVTQADLNLGWGLGQPRLQGPGPIRIAPTTANGRAVISKLLGWLRVADSLPESPSPTPGFGDHVLTFSLPRGRSLTVSQDYLPDGSGGYRASPSVVLVSALDAANSGRYRSPALAGWLSAEWSHDAELMSAGWTCAQRTPPNGGQNVIGGTFGNGAQWIVAADAAHSCVVLYTGNGSGWKRSTVATHVLSHGGATVEQVQFLDPFYGFVLVGGSPGAGQVSRVLYATRDGGLTWRSLPDAEQPFPSSDTDVNMRFTSPSDGWLVTVTDFHDPGRVFVYRTTDGGEIWTQTAFGLPADARSADYPAASPPLFQNALDGTIRVLSPWRGVLFFTTTDGGKHWTYDALGNG